MLYNREAKCHTLGWEEGRHSDSDPTVFAPDLATGEGEMNTISDSTGKTPAQRAAKSSKAKKGFAVQGTAHSDTEPLLKAIEEPHLQNWAELFCPPAQERRGTCQPRDS